MANKKTTSKKTSATNTNQVKKKSSNAGYIAVLVSLAVALVIFVGCAVGILLYNLPDKASTDSEQSTSSTVDDDDGWSKNY